MKPTDDAPSSLADLAAGLHAAGAGPSDVFRALNDLGCPPEQALWIICGSFRDLRQIWLTLIDFLRTSIGGWGEPARSRIGIGAEWFQAEGPHWVQAFVESLGVHPASVLLSARHQGEARKWAEATGISPEPFPLFGKRSVWSLQGLEFQRVDLRNDPFVGHPYGFLFPAGREVSFAECDLPAVLNILLAHRLDIWRCRGLRRITGLDWWSQGDGSFHRLNLEDHDVFEALPENLSVPGSMRVLSLPRNPSQGMQSLPRGLQVSRNLHLDVPGLKNLPTDLSLGGDLVLRHLGLEVFPAALQLQRDLALDGAGLLKGGGGGAAGPFPSNLAVLPFTKPVHVPGHLRVEHFPRLECLPAGLTFGEGLRIGFCPHLVWPAPIDADDLSDALEIEGSLSLEACRVERLPRRLKARSLILRDLPRLKALPEDLELSGDLVLEDCPGVRRWPAAFKVNGQFRIERNAADAREMQAQLGSLPASADFTRLSLVRCRKAWLPSELQERSEVRIHESQKRR